MKFSNYFLPTLKNIPAEAEIVSHQLMIRSGMIKQSSAGIYSWLPLGLRVLKKIEQIVREEQNNAGAIEILIIAVIFGVIYGRDAIDRTGKKNPNEGVVESFTEDVKEYYQEDPKRLFKLIVLLLSIITFLATLVYWAITNYDIAKMIGLTQ